MSKRREPLEFNVRYWSLGKKHWTILAKFSWQADAEFFAEQFSAIRDSAAKIAVFHRHNRQRIYVAGAIVAGYKAHVPPLATKPVPLGAGETVQG